MEVSFKKSFIKDLKNLPKNIQEKIKKLVFEEIPNKNSLSEIPNVKKLKESIELVLNTKMERFIRRQIYKKFP
jgi:mRNA-degrading endonuclease RelE of RelBE toxin-antitoxin system